MSEKSSNANSVVIDASVVMALLMPDERLHLSESFAYFLTNTGPHLIAPRLLLYEVTNALRMAVVRKRMTYENARQGLIDLQILKISYSNLENPNQLLETAHHLDITAYDAAYVYVATHQSAVLCTFDSKLKKKVTGFVEILEIE